MNILHEIPDSIGKFKNPVLSIGTFDGVHAGHQKILRTLLAVAEEKQTDAVVLTFESHPRKILTPATPPKILTTKHEKIEAIAGCGINNIIIIKFTNEIANMPADEFLNRMIIDKIGISHLVVGYDHAFGKDRDGDFNYLNEIAKDKGFGITRVEPQIYHSVPVSSTWIRAEIEDGNISFANGLLLRRYTIFGNVDKGDGRGAKLGFPTANIVPEDADKIIPKDGVYAVKAVINNDIKKDGMLNIGTNPTFSKTERTIELNIFDFNKNIYNNNIHVEFFERIRDEVKFNTPEALIEQLHKDEKTARDILRKEANL
ncbi:MAG: bifunctional riboflavin kinase/FAD synthetase [Spirochaetota bacterium]